MWEFGPTPEEILEDMESGPEPEDIEDNEDDD